MKTAIFALLLACAGIVNNAAADEPVDLGHVVVYSGDASFAEAKEGLKFAIGNLGMVISNELHLSDMLDRTGADIGNAKQVYARAETIAWCSASLSRKMVESEATSLVFCPFQISLYELADEPGQIHAAFRKPLLGDGASDASKAVMKEIEAMYAQVAEAAVSGGF